MGSDQSGLTGLTEELGGHYHNGSWYLDAECPHVPERQRLDLDNGAQIVCKHDFLPIGWSAGRWIHAYNGQQLCRPGDPRHHPRTPLIAEPYLTPQAAEYLRAAVRRALEGG